MRFSAICLLLLLTAGCSPRDTDFRVVANGRIFSVASMITDNRRYLDMDGVREILTHMGAVVDNDGATRTLAVEFTNGDDAPLDWPSAPADSAYTVVFNEHVLRTAYVDDEGRAYLPLDAFRSLCVAMKRRVSDPPYDDLIAVSAPEGEALPGTDSATKTHAVQLPGKGGH